MFNLAHPVVRLYFVQSQRSLNALLIHVLYKITVIISQSRRTDSDYHHRYHHHHHLVVLCSVAEISYASSASIYEDVICVAGLPGYFRS